eukprot:3195338-Alexandrium_andersonii.AAC.1
MKTELDKIVQEALKVRNKLHQVCNGSRSLIDQIKSSDAWAWARNDGNVGKVERALNELMSKLNEFGKSFLVSEMGKLKVAVPQDKLQATFRISKLHTAQK